MTQEGNRDRTTDSHVWAYEGETEGWDDPESFGVPAHPPTTRETAVGVDVYGEARVRRPGRGGIGLETRRPGGGLTREPMRYHDLGGGDTRGPTRPAPVRSFTRRDPSGPVVVGEGPTETLRFGGPFHGDGPPGVSR